MHLLHIFTLNIFCWGPEVMECFSISTSKTNGLSIWFDKICEYYFWKAGIKPNQMKCLCKLVVHKVVRGTDTACKGIVSAYLKLFVSHLAVIHLFKVFQPIIMT